jgi:hypothetical protein
LAILESVVGLADKLFRPGAFSFLLPLAPGGVLIFGLPLMVPDVEKHLSGYPKFFGAATSGVVGAFGAYVVGGCLLSVLSLAVQFGAQLFAQESPVINSSNLAKPAPWRRIATEFLGAKLTPPLKINSPTKTDDSLLNDLRAAVYKAEVFQNDEEWGRWYSILGHYYRSARPGGAALEFLPAIHSSGWAAIILFLIHPAQVAWVLWPVAVFFALGGMGMQFFLTLPYAYDLDTDALAAAMLKDMKACPPPIIVPETPVTPAQVKEAETPSGGSEGKPSS